MVPDKGAGPALISEARFLCGFRILGETNESRRERHLRRGFEDICLSSPCPSFPETVETGAFKVQSIFSSLRFRSAPPQSSKSHQRRWLWSNKKKCLYSSVTSRLRRHGGSVSRDPAEGGEVSCLKRDARASHRLAQCPAKVTPAIQRHLRSGAKRVWY